MKLTAGTQELIYYKKYILNFQELIYYKKYILDFSYFELKKLIPFRNLLNTYGTTLVP